MGFLDALGKIGTAVSGFTPLGMVTQAVGGLIGSAMDNHANKKIAQMNYDAQMATNEANKQMTESTNAANLEIARQNNLWNRESAAMQNQWNQMQWQRENAYNSPEAMASRLLAAGINPSNAGLDGVQPAGQLQSADVASASDAGRQVAPQFVAPRFDYTQTLFSSALQHASLLGDIASKNYDLQERKATFAERMDNLKAMNEQLRQQGKLTKFQASIAETMDAVKQLTFNDEVAGIHQDLLTKLETTKNLIASSANLEAQADLAKFQKDFVIPKQLNLQEQQIKASLEAAALSYRASLAAAAASRYGSDMSYKSAHEATEAAKEKASNDFVIQLRQAGVNERQVRVAERQFNLMINREQYERSALKYLQDVSKGAVGGAVPAAAGYIFGKGVKPAPNMYPSYSTTYSY